MGKQEAKRIIAVNGTDSYLETHYEVVSFLERTSEVLGSRAEEAQANGGRGRMYELAAYLTAKFEEQNKDREWDGEYFDEIDAFLSKEENYKDFV